MIRHLDDNGAILLLAAIVQRAEVDYKVSARRIDKLKDKTDKKSMDKLRLAKRMKADCERFFRSDHFTALTGENGQRMLDRLEEGAEAATRRSYIRVGAN